MKDPHVFVGQYPLENRDPSFWDQNKTPFLCWNCTLSMVCPVYSYPVERNQFKWSVRGVFCTLACVLRYILEHPRLRPTYLNLLHDMMHEIYECHGTLIPAPPFECLQMYGGPLSADEYRNMLKNPSYPLIKLTLPQVVPFPCKKEQFLQLLTSQAIPCPFADDDVRAALGLVYVREYPLNHVTERFWRRNLRGYHCWHCKMKFEGRIYSYPVKRKEKWHVRGIFCSLSCVKRYLVEHPRFRSEFFHLFSLMAWEMYGVRDAVPLAPQFEKREAFAGPLSDDVFQQQVQCTPFLRKPNQFQMDHLCITSELVRRHPLYPMFSWCLTAFREHFGTLGDAEPDARTAKPKKRKLPPRAKPVVEHKDIRSFFKPI